MSIRRQRPRSSRFWLGRLSELLGRRHLRLADEERVAALFLDCDRGAVPALGMVWGLQTVVDDGLEYCDVVYLERGDHERLLKVTRDQFRALIQPVLHGRSATCASTDPADTAPGPSSARGMPAAATRHTASGQFTRSR